MRKLHTVAFYALLAPVLTLSAGSLLAQQPSTQRDQTQSQQSQPSATQPSTQRSTQPSSQPSSTQPSSQPSSQPSATQRSTQPSASQPSATQRSATQPSASQPSATQRSTQPGTQQPQTTRMGGSEYLTTAPSNAMRAEKIMGSDVMTSGDEDVGPVNDLIFDEEGKLLAIVVGVGGFLGAGEKDVAISWDSITHSTEDDEHVLRVNTTREDLRSAPEFDADN